MISIFAPCPKCVGACVIDYVTRCSACDGTGRTFAPGAPSFGCAQSLADRWPGEVVTLGNGERVKILWHMPRRKRDQVPETTFVDLLEPFSELESYRPLPYPSSVGVFSVDQSREPKDSKTHARERSVDIGDPLQRQERIM